MLNCSLETLQNVGIPYYNTDDVWYIVWADIFHVTVVMDQGNGRTNKKGGGG